jgi:hypothetical protein
VSYYARTAGVNTDGTPTFATAQDKASEAEVAELITQRLGGYVITMPHLCPVDWLVVQHGRIRAVADLKTRSRRYPTVWLNLRKYAALMLTARGLESTSAHPVAPLFLVRYPDALLVADLRAFPGLKPVMGGTVGWVKSSTDVEPVLELPVAQMTEMARWAA